MSSPYKHLFSLPDGLHYLNCAYMAPLSRRVADAGRAAIERLEAPSRIQVPDFFEHSDAARRLFARLINVADHRRIAIIPSVSYAMATVAKNLRMKPDQNIVVIEEQFPSNVYSWRRACADAGAELRAVAAPRTVGRRAAAWNDAVVAAIDRRTALVTVPHLHWTDGTRFDLDEIGQRARACGARFVIDGTQSVGAVPLDCERLRPDAVACAGYKWLTGPYAAGLAFFGSAYDDGVPLEENWITREGSEDFADLVRYRDEYQPGAIRYDVGERSNFVLLPMLCAALEQVVEWGPETVSAYTRELLSGAVPQLRELGCRVEDDAWRAPHLLGVRVPTGLDVASLARELARRQVSVSVRGNAIRVAPHLYNEPDDVTALVAVIREARSS